LVLLAGLALSQPCDREALKRRIDSPLGYAVRNGNRCEGFFSSLHSSSKLAILSFTIGSFSQSLSANDTVLIGIPELSFIRGATPAVADSNVRLRVSPLQQHVGYQMDAVTQSSSIVVWPLEVIAHASPDLASTADIGVLAKTSHQQDTVIVPVRLYADDSPATVAKDTLVLTLVSSRPLFQVRWRIYQPGEPTPGYQIISSREMLHASRANILIPPGAEQILRLDVEALLDSGEKVRIYPYIARTGCGPASEM
jgi:hypothetical protein